MNMDNKVRLEYHTPLIDCVELDVEISLALESTPPEGPGGSESFAPGYFNNDPFKPCLG